MLETWLLVLMEYLYRFSLISITLKDLLLGMLLWIEQTSIVTKMFPGINFVNGRKIFRTFRWLFDITICIYHPCVRGASSDGRAMECISKGHEFGSTKDWLSSTKKASKPCNISCISLNAASHFMINLKQWRNLTFWALAHSGKWNRLFWDF